MKLVSWNVNGIRAVIRKGLFLPMIRDLNPDILCMQETKAEKGQADIDLPQFEEYWNSSESRKGYSGTAIFSKVKPLSVQFGFDEKIVKQFNLKDGYGNLNAEGRVVSAEYDNFFVVNVYTPNAKPDLSRLEMREKHWDPAFLAHCVKLKKSKPVIFCGDLNVAHKPIDLARPKENEGTHGYTKEERIGIDKIISNGFVDSFRMFNSGGENYTWWSNLGNARARNVGWRIDYFFVSDTIQTNVKKAEIHPNIFGSDHCPISITVS